MRQVAAPHNPTVASDLGALAGLYRTVFWMIGRKSQYGRVWPREADMGKPVPETTESPLIEIESRAVVEAVAKE